MHKLLLKHLVLFLVGGILYVLMEILWRGYSHWSMLMLGGICFVLIGLINEVIPWEMPLWKQGIIAAAIITTLEFITGCIVNLWLGWNVWDYSDVLLNFYGQICLPFFLLWVIIGIAAVVLDDWLRFWWFGEDKPSYRVF